MSEQKHVLYEKDAEILRSLNTFRYLKTEQIQRLVFPNCKTSMILRRRLKYLHHARFVGRIIPFEQAGNGRFSCVYYIDQQGIAYLRENGQKVLSCPQSVRTRQMFLRHALDVSEFRIALEFSLQQNLVCTICDVVLDFELKAGTEKAVGVEKYRLNQKVKYGKNKVFHVFPDMSFILQGIGNHDHFQKLFFVEIDHGTMGLNKIQEKIAGYNAFLKRDFCKRLGIGRFSSFKVLLQTHSEKRAKAIFKALQSVKGKHLVWITHRDLVNERSVLQEKIWLNAHGERKSMNEEFLESEILHV